MRNSAVSRFAHNSPEHMSRSRKAVISPAATRDKLPRTSLTGAPIAVVTRLDRSEISIVFPDR